LSKAKAQRGAKEHFDGNPNALTPDRHLEDIPTFKRMRELSNINLWRYFICGRLQV
jgi:hypothetical protein